MGIEGVSSFITKMTKPGAMAPIIALEATVTGGRTIQAYKRGGEDEARERFIEEATGAVVWLGGVKFLNDCVGDPILKKLFGANFDVGTDNVLRTPFENFMKKHPQKRFSEKQVALIKASKVLASVVLADAFIGFVVPPLNQKLTRKLRNKAKEEQAKLAQDKLELSNKNDDKTEKANNLAFKGGISAINVFTNAIENTNTGKLLSTDVGLTGGRLYSARNNDERREIAIRDIGSIYFYMWAQGHVGNLLNLILIGKPTRLNPNTTALVHERLLSVLESKGGEMSIEEFKSAVLGKTSSEVELPRGINFESGKLSWFDNFMNKFRSVKAEPLQVAKVDDLKGLFEENIFTRIQEMSLLQPERKGIRVVTKQQIIDALNIAEINDPKFLDEVFTKFTGGASKDPFKFVSNSKLYDLKAEIEDYINLLCKDAKEGKITKSALEKAKNKNLIGSGLNWAAGFAVAALFLSTIIPKIQYWVTRMKTGKNEFPGVADLD